MNRALLPIFIAATTFFRRRYTAQFRLFLGTVVLAFFPIWLFAAAGKKEVKIGIINLSSSAYDLTTIYLDYGTSPAYFNLEDAYKVFNPSPVVPQIYSLTTDSVECQNNGYGPFVSTAVIPLGFEVDSGGNYQIFCNLLDNIDPTSIVRLEDKFTGNFYDLRQGTFSFTVSHSTKNNSRFVLHISLPPLVSTTDATCSNNDGVIQINQDPSIAWNVCQLYDTTNTLVGSYNNVTGNFQFLGLPEGRYTIVYLYNTYVATQSIELNGFYVTNHIGASKVTATVGELVQFFSLTVNATQFFWDFGDGSQIYGIAFPQFNYMAPGNYMVVMRAFNQQGCEAYDTLFITIIEATGVSDVLALSATVYCNESEIIIKHLPEGNTQIQLFSTTGQLVHEQESKGAATTQISSSFLPKGIYLLHLQNGNALLTKRVILQ
ncbi:MAG: T9SS type A sorting domain-containing protein [Chitinophagales bacterium]|nr:T9SS type A sorting domain-containing protein [Chitinophagales bacterium]